MSVKIELKDYKQIMSDLGKLEKSARKVVDATTKDFKSRGPGWISQEVTKEYRIKKAEVSKSSSAGTVKPKLQGDTISIAYKGRVLTPLHFLLTPKAAKGFKNSKTLVNADNLNIAGGRTPPTAYARTPRKYKVSVTIKKGSKKQLLGKNDNPVFIGPNGLPFQRTGDGRKIDVIRTVSLPQMVGNEEVQENISKTIDEKLGKRFEHHMKRFMGR